MSRFGIDSEQIKTTLKRNAVSMMLFGNFKLERLRYVDSHETGIAELSKLDNYKRDFIIWKSITLQRAYDSYKSD